MITLFFKCSLCLVTITVTNCLEETVSPNYGPNLALLNLRDDPDREDSESSLSTDGLIRDSFALNLINLINNKIQNSTNVACSPFSTVYMLGKLLMAVEEESNAEIQLIRAMGERTQGNTLNKFGSLKYGTLKIISEMFVTDKSVIREEFIEAMNTQYNTSVTQISFDNYQKTAKIINDQINNSSDGKITNSVTEADIDEPLVIVNAAYFNSTWKVPFKMNDKKMKFFTASNKTKEVDGMWRLGHYLYYNSTLLQAQLIEIPYKDRPATLLIVLPENSSSLQTITSTGTMTLIQEETYKMEYAKLKLQIPMFKIDCSFDMADVLKMYDVHDIFKKNEGLSLLLKSRKSVPVKGAKHHVIIDLGQDVTTGSGQDAIARAWLGEDPEVSIDRPFLFFVVVHGEQIISGIVNDPTQTDPSLL